MAGAARVARSPVAGGGCLLRILLAATAAVTAVPAEAVLAPLVVVAVAVPGGAAAQPDAAARRRRDGGVRRRDAGPRRLAKRPPRTVEPDVLDAGVADAGEGPLDAGGVPLGNDLDAGTTLSEELLDAGGPDALALPAELDAGIDAAIVMGAGIDAALAAPPEPLVQPPDAGAVAVAAPATGPGPQAITVPVPIPIETAPAPSEDRRLVDELGELVLGGRSAERVPDGPGPGPELVPPMPERDTGKLIGLLLLLGIAFGGAYTVRRTRRLFPEHGIFPRALGVTHAVLRACSLLLAVAIAVRLVPPSLDPWMRFALVGLAVAAGWSARDVLADLIAGVAVGFERKIRPGVFISGDGWAGRVESRGLRAVFLRDARGHTIAVPNRRILVAPTVADTGEGEQEVTVHVDSTRPAAEVRRALEDAVLMSPWVRPGTKPVVLRDGDGRGAWRIRSRLLEPGHAGRFEADLRERTEELFPAAGTGPPA
jgi:hypothetical protein